MSLDCQTSLIPPHHQPARAGLPWAVRAVQIDLARRWEPLDAIFRFADFAASQRFNVLVLYLEGRIQTAAFPYRPAAGSYTPGDMAKVVAHAAGVGLEVVPVVSTLGHCEQFLPFPEMAALAEERTGAARLGDARPSTFCPSLPRTYEFWRAYLSEIAPIFPSPHFHIGCDETWNLGFCPLCRTRWERDGLGTLFLDHVLAIRNVCGELGKRVWMWDDFFEFFPEILERTPRDVLLCHWNYDAVIEPRGPQAHFVNRRRREWLRDYAALGFDALVCPWAVSAANVETSTDYGRRAPVLGGLLTQWGLDSQEYEQYHPVVAFTGCLWAADRFDPDAAWGDTPAGLKRLAQTMPHFPPADLSAFLRGPLGEGERQRRDLVQSIQEYLTHGAEREAASQAGVRTHNLAAARLEMLYWAGRDLLPAVHDPRRPAEDTPRLLRSVEAARQLLRLIRSDGPNAFVRTRLADVERLLDAASEHLGHAPLPDEWWLVLRLFLPDVYAMPFLKVTVGLAGGEEKEIADAVFKPLTMTIGSFYTVQLPFRCARPPEQVTIEMTGYGAQGIAYLEAQHSSAVSTPGAVVVLEGIVSEPDAVLRDDHLAATLGQRAVLPAFNEPSPADTVARLRVTLKPQGAPGDLQAHA